MHVYQTATNSSQQDVDHRPPHTHPWQPRTQHQTSSPHQPHQKTSPTSEIFFLTYPPVRSKHPCARFLPNPTFKKPPHITRLAYTFDSTPWRQGPTLALARHSKAQPGWQGSGGRDQGHTARSRPRLMRPPSARPAPEPLAP